VFLQKKGNEEEEDDDDQESGINIEKVKELLKKRDEEDKEMYRKRIKQMHTVDLESQFLLKSIWFII
jgi:hypothetical protein